MKYPFILFYRYDKYKEIDNFFDTNKENSLFSITITNDKNDLNKLFDSSNQILITYGDSDCSEYVWNVQSIIADRMNKRWIHLNELTDINYFNGIVNYCFINNVVDNPASNRPVFSIFTTCYKSYDKIFRAYNSIKKQTLKDWEWVILDDSPEDDHFLFLKSIFKNDKRIRLYKRSENSGNIGNVKNESVLLCRGKYLLELDHDDEILPDTLYDSAQVFDKDPEVGFIYMDFANLYENGNNFSYGDFFALGYSGYYCQKHDNKWINVAICPNINSTTLSHIVAIPNHPRIWRKTTLLDIGNYSEFLPISDDYELILRTAVHTKMCRIPKLGYIQYMNHNNNNFSLIRNSEINRLCVSHLYPQCYEKYNINEKMKELNAFEDPIYSKFFSQIWKRENYQYKYCNQIINVNHKKQFCILGLENFHKHKELLKKLYHDPTNDFLLLDNKYNMDDLSREIDYLRFDRMKCYYLADNTTEELIKYYKLIYKNCEDSIIIDSNFNELSLQNYIDVPKRKITIITPCIRPENLLKIQESIDFDYVDNWYIIYDGTKISELPNLLEKHDKIKEYIYVGEGISGNPQRNYALDLIETQDTYLYFLDDDNIIHRDFYSLLDKLEPGRIYTFDQSRPNNVYPYKELLTGDNIEIYNIDTAMFLIDFNLCKNIRWEIDKYNADGYYIKECYEKNKDNWIYVNKIMSYYNKLV